MNRGIRYIIILALSALLLFVANLLFGSIHIPVEEVFRILCGEDGSRESWSFIIWSSRFPQAVTALLCGMALSVCGLMLQTIFNNPLAGPEVLGINSGANLGVALVMLLFGGQLSMLNLTVGGFVAVIVAAFLGAMLVTGVILFFSSFIRSNILLLIIGITLSYLTSSFVSLLNYFATAEGVHSYMIWGFGNFSGVSLQQLLPFSVMIVLGIIIALLLIKPLNALLLGTAYASNLGINVKRTRYLLLIATGLLTAVTTAYCGPVSFIGLAVPHIARMLLGTNNHRLLMPATLLAGGCIALLCNLICQLPGESGLIPLSAITPLIGAPVIIYVILRQRQSLS